MTSYEELRNEALELNSDIENLQQTFQKNNKDRRRQSAHTFLKKTSEFKQQLETINDKLLLLNKDGVYSERSYFIEKLYDALKNKFKVFEKIVNEYIEKDQDDNSKKMSDEKLADILKLLTDNAVKKQDNKADMIKTASSIIVKFDKNNISNFVDSVGLAIKFCGNEHIEDVLRLAKNKITNCVAIETRTYDSFEGFKADILTYFKPKRSVTEVEGLICRLTQSFKESVDDYSKRTFLLKTDYEMAVKAERQAMSHTMDDAKISEMESKVANAFINGLKENVFRFIREKPTTLANAVTIAMEAESTSNLRFENKRLAESSSDFKKRGDKFDSGSGKGGFRNDKHNRSPNSQNHKSFQKNSYGKNFQKQGEKKDYGPRKCYECGSDAHLRYECPKLKNPEQAQATAMVAKPDRKRDDTQKPKNGDACGVSVSAQSLKIKSRR